MDMEQFDAQKATRVWQRVQNRETPEPLRKDQVGLIRAVGEQAAYYRNLSRAMPGKYGERLRDYGRQQQRAAECLKGICRITGIPLPQGQHKAMPPEPPMRMLEKCCHGEKGLVAEYTARAADPEWGRVYTRMATEAAERCCGLLEILGAMGK